jgi:hypothetical protein
MAIREIALEFFNLIESPPSSSSAILKIAGGG